MQKKYNPQEETTIHLIIGQPDEAHAFTGTVENFEYVQWNTQNLQNI